jgi:hypothetical protein
MKNKLGALGLAMQNITWKDEAPPSTELDNHKRFQLSFVFSTLTWKLTWDTALPKYVR